jgi:DNA-binding IclR family transcriptional regulator
MHCSSTGKIFLANMKEEELMHFLSSKTLNARTSKTITEKDALMMELSQVQAQGYAFDNEEYFEDVRCLAVPIHNRAAEVIGAIGITATSNRFSQDRNEEILNLIKNSAGNIEHKLLT